jgi:hypothetical protein
MALITDPDFLNQGVEVDIDYSTKVITLNIAGNLSSDGVTLKAVYSFLKEEWREDPALIKFDFPMTPITDEQMQIGVSSRNNGWNWGDTTTRELIRTGGWQEVDGYGVVQSEYAGIVSLGELQTGTQAYYQQQIGGGTDNFVLPDEINQAVQIYENGNFDYRGYFKVFAREQGDRYASADLNSIGVTTMTYQVYRFPLATAIDLKITADDLDIDSNSDGYADQAPYDGMSITYYSTPQSRLIGASSYNFGVIIDANNSTAEQIYEFVQFSLRQDLNINDGFPPSIVGRTADELLEFVGDTLKTKSVNNVAGGGSGVFIDNFLTADINRLAFQDNTGTERVFPFTANITFNFSQTLVNDGYAVYRSYFTTDDAGSNDGYDFGTINAIIPRSSFNYSITDRERNSDIATLTTATSHFLSIGDVVEVIDMDDSSYNSVAVVLSVPTAVTFTYESTGSNEGSTAETGGEVYRCMGGNVSAQPSVSFGYDYDSNVQRGIGSEGEDAPITVVAIGLSGAQYVLATGNIARSTANAISLVAPIERNYANPV